jgi:NADP-dependent 3-hydroxy acid dehydrogenase YdfG
VLARYPKLDVLVNNAGAMYGTRQLTKDGIELTWAVNHLAPFLLTKLLLHRLKESAPARIITTASQAHQGVHIPFDDLNAERSYRSFGRYCETKLANILFTTELARRLDGTGVTANCFHPGLVATGFNRNNGLLMDWGMTILGPVSRSPEKGAETLVWLATSPDVANVSGAYFFDQEQIPPAPRHKTQRPRGGSGKSASGSTRSGRLRGKSRLTNYRASHLLLPNSWADAALARALTDDYIRAICGRVIQSSGPLRYAIVDGMNVRDSRVHNYPPRWNAAPQPSISGHPT